MYICCIYLYIYIYISFFPKQKCSEEGVLTFAVYNYLRCTVFPKNWLVGKYRPRKAQYVQSIDIQGFARWQGRPKVSTVGPEQ